MTSDIDFSTPSPKPVECRHCGQRKAEHKSGTHHCPLSRARFTHFSTSTVFEPEPCPGTFVRRRKVLRIADDVLGVLRGGP
jgi:hypothetical protein